MKKKLKTFVKRFNFIYKFYYIFGNLLVNTLKIFVKPSYNTILFVSYGGKKYDDSPKVIYEYILGDDRFANCELIWAFDDPNNFSLKTKKIKIDTLKYYIIALKARIWITNSSIERGLDFKGKNTIYINTWHGTPLKKMGKDIPRGNISFKSNAKLKVDVMLSQSKYESNIFSKAYDIELSKFRLLGLPRNDELLLDNKDKKRKILEQFDISPNKKIILYAPTFREYDRDNTSNCVYNSPFNFELMYEYFGKDTIIFLRMHYEISNYFNKNNNLEKFLIDVSSYKSLNELLIVSDILITDYSSIMFDYSIMKKPIVTFTYDFEKYICNRGLYFDIRKYLPNASDMDDLINILIDIKNRYNHYCQITEGFRKQYIDKFGDATHSVVEEVCKYIN